MPWFRMDIHWFEDERLEQAAEKAGADVFAVAILMRCFAAQRGMAAGAKVEVETVAVAARMPDSRVRQAVDALIEAGLFAPLRYHAGDLIHVRVNFSLQYRSTITPKQRRRLIARDRGTCGICGEVVAEDEELHIDHIQPVSRGGSSEDSNLQVSHARCNRKKAARVGA